MSLNRKATNNAAVISANNANIQTITGVTSIMENVVSAAANTTTTPWYPYTLDYSLGSVFYIPSDYATSANFQVIIKNIPTDTSKTYVVTLMYYQPSNMVFCNYVRCSDVTLSYILGTSSTFAFPLFSNGVPTISSSPNLIIQTFNIISIPTSGGTYSRYITTSINCSF